VPLAPESFVRNAAKLSSVTASSHVGLDIDFGHFGLIKIGLNWGVFLPCLLINIQNKCLMDSFSTRPLKGG
jgi:hypothetical protein